MRLSEFGGSFIGGGPYTAADGQIRHGGAGYLSWFIPEGAGPLSITCIHGGGGQSTDFMHLPDGSPGWLHAFLDAGFAVYLLDRPGHGRAAWAEEHLGPCLPPPDYETMSARFMHPAKAALWPQAGLHSQWPQGADDAFMASQGGMSNDLARAQAHAEAIAAALFDRVGDTVLVTHSAGGPCGWAMASHANPGQVRAIMAVEPQGAPGMVHPLGRFDHGLTVAPLGGPEDPYQRPIAVMTAEASWMRASNAQVVQWLQDRGTDVSHIKLEEHGLHGNGHMIPLEMNAQASAALVIEWINRTVVKAPIPNRRATDA